jgi:hypothetical protein
VNWTSSTAPREGDHGKTAKNTAAAKITPRDRIRSDFVDVATTTPSISLKGSIPPDSAEALQKASGAMA